MNVGDDNSMVSGIYGLSSMSSYESLRGVVIDSLSSEPIQGAVVSILSKKMRVRHIATNHKGEFNFMNVSCDGLKIEITHLGYTIYDEYIDEKSTRNIDLGKISLAEDKRNIDAVVVEARMQFFSVKGDTIQFNPAAVKLLDGDMALDIMKKMPGVEITNSGVKIMGESIAVTYVNGEAIYGNNALGALQYIEGGNVSSIRAYDEIDAEGSLESGSLQRQKVIDVITFEMFTKNIVADIFANYGADIEKASGTPRQNRYAVGGGMGYFSEKQQFAIEATLDNTGVDRWSSPIATITTPTISTAGDGYNRSTNLAFAYNQKIGKERTSTYKIQGVDVERKYYKHAINSYYKYNEGYSSSRNISKRLYFPTEEYANRIYADTLTSDNTTTTHDVGLIYRHKGTVDFEVRTSLNYHDNHSNSYSGATNIVDDKVVNSSAMNSSSASDNLLFNGGVHVGSYESKFRVETDLKYQNINQAQWQVDTLGSSTNSTFLTSATKGDNYNANAALYYNIKSSDKLNLSANYQFEVTDNSSQRTSIDELTGRVDTTTTHNFTDKKVVHSVGVSLSKRLSPKLDLGVTISPRLSILGRDDRFPELAEQNKKYFTPYASLSLTNRAVNFIYSLTTSTPSLEQLNNKLDNTNPLLLTVGYFDIEPTSNHRLNLNYSKYFEDGRSNIMAMASANLESNYITSTQKYFTENTYLPEYQYTAQKGSTLSSYTNVGGKFDVNARFDYTTSVKLLGSRFSTSMNVRYSELPIYIGQELVTTKSIQPKLKLALTTNFSSKFAGDITAETIYDISKNSHIKDRRFNERLNVMARYNPHSRVFINTAYEYNFLMNTNPNIADIHNQVWNATVGMRLLSDKSCNLSVSVYDILNKNKAYATSLQDGYNLESWNQIMSRYFTVNMSFRFNKK